MSNEPGVLDEQSEPENIICRYCLEPQSELKSELIFPCGCKTPICTECLTQHIQTNNKTICEICQSRFDIQSQVTSILVVPPDFETGIGNEIGTDIDISLGYDAPQDEHNESAIQESINDNLDTDPSDNSSVMPCTEDNAKCLMMIAVIVILLVLGIIYKDKIRFYK